MNDLMRGMLAIVKRRPFATHEKVDDTIFETVEPEAEMRNLHHAERDRLLDEGRAHQPHLTD